MEPYLPHLQWIASQEQHMIHLVESWSRINSGSYHLAGLERMRAALEDNFLWLHGEMEVLDLPAMEMVDAHGERVEVEMGKAIRIRKRPDAAIQIFLGGHYDTVFPEDCSFQEPVYKDNDVASGVMNGPGVADLKGGLVVMLKALEAFEKSKWSDNIGWEIVLNPDEEIGSQSSNMVLAEAAKRNHFGFIYEPSLPDGSLAGARKGSGNFHWVVRGVAAHAGREFAKGKNAIVAASQLVNKLYALNGQRDDVTLNIGKIEGGGALNQVPDLAVVRMNTRIACAEDKEWLLEGFSHIENEISSFEGISLSRFGKFTRAPKPMAPANQRLFEMVRETGAMLEQPIRWNATGGCCDGNNMWEHGLPNVDTLGVRGGDIHSDKEYILLDSLVERAQLSALMLMRIASGEVNMEALCSSAP